MNTLGNDTLPLKGECNVQDILSNWEAEEVDSLRAILSQANYDPETKFAAYEAKSSVLKDVIAQLTSFAPGGNADASHIVTTAIPALEPIQPLSLDFDDSNETIAEKRSLCRPISSNCRCR
jgi:hypothetical protein